MLHKKKQKISKNVTLDMSVRKSVILDIIISKNVTFLVEYLPSFDKGGKYEMKLNENEQKTYNIIEKVINNEMTRKEAMHELNRSRQQIYRLINLYHLEGKEGFIHKGRGKANPNKKEEG